MSGVSPGATVTLSQRYGGGMGTVDIYNDGDETAIIDVKGSQLEVPVDELELAISSDACTTIVQVEVQKAEIKPGDQVRVTGMFGSGCGEGFGIFVAHSLDGQSAIVNIDSQDTSVPIELVSLAPEQTDIDNFNTCGGDGTMSPVSTVNNDLRDACTADKWSNVAQGTHVSEDADLYAELQTAIEECANSTLREGTDMDINDLHAEDEHFTGDEFETEYANEPHTDYSQFEDDDEADEAYAAEAEPLLTAPEYGDAPADVADLIAKIEYIQDMGMSNSKVHYSPENLEIMRPEAIQRIYSKVVGETSVEEDINWNDHFDNDREAGQEDEDEFNAPVADANEYGFEDDNDDAMVHGEVIPLDNDEVGAEVAFDAPENPMGDPEDTEYDISHSDYSKPEMLQYRKAKAKRQGGEFASSDMHEDTDTRDLESNEVDPVVLDMMERLSKLR